MMDDPRTRRAALKREGRCINCGQPAVNANYCAWHRDYHNRWKREHYARSRARQHDYRVQAYRTYRLENPLRCRWCERPLAVGEGRRGYHAACLAVKRAATIPLHPPTPAVRRRAARAYQERRLAEGRCPQCGTPRDGRQQECARCRRRAAARYHARRARP